MMGNHQVRFGGRPCGKGPAQQAPRRAADPTSWLNQARRNVRDYERLPEHSEAHLNWAAITLMTRRLVRQQSLTARATADAAQAA